MYKILFLIGSFLSFGANLLAMEKPVEVEAAGVLPFCIYKGKGYFLIGKSKFDHTYWSDFGGFRDKTDKSIEYAAAREFSEETRHVFGRLINDYSLDGSINYILRQIKNDQFLKNTFKAKRDGQLIVYTMYIAEVDYISAETFNQAAKVLNYDKEEYLWIPAEEFLHHCTDKHAKGIFEKKSLRYAFWTNLIKNREYLPKILSVIKDTPSKAKIELPQQPDINISKGIANLFAIAAPKLAIMAVVAGVGYWGYKKYIAYKEAQESDKQKQKEEETENKHTAHNK